MEKALEILRNENVFDEEYLCFNNIDIASAIKELEEAMKPKTCEECKYNTDNKPRCFKYNDCFREHTRETKQDRYEPKDTQC